MDEDTIRKKIELEVEVGATTQTGKNRFQYIIDLAEAIDAWRIFPRVFISVYIYLLYEVVIWFMELDKPSMEQAGLISVMTGVGAAWFGLYTKTKGDGN